MMLLFTKKLKSQNPRRLTTLLLAVFSVLYPYPSENKQPFGPPNQFTESGGYRGELWNPLPKDIIDRIRGKSWNENCPITLDDLAYIKVSHWNFDNEITTGELIFHKQLAQEMVEIFQDLFEAHFPIEKMKLIDAYDADDDRSMEDNNSSAFCSRAITGRPGIFSVHSYGKAIDINPLYNPYVKGNTVLPKGSEKFVDRSLEVPGLIKVGNPCYQAFIKRGYQWGGHWSSLKDYQHFEKVEHNGLEKEQA